jgi:hypothetical protein
MKTEKPMFDFFRKAVKEPIMTQHELDAQRAEACQSVKKWCEGRPAVEMRVEREFVAKKLEEYSGDHRTILEAAVHQFEREIANKEQRPGERLSLTPEEESDLENLIDRVSIYDVLNTLSDICGKRNVLHQYMYSEEEALSRAYQKLRYKIMDCIILASAVYLRRREALAREADREAEERAHRGSEADMFDYSKRDPWLYDIK